MAIMHFLISSVILTSLSHILLIKKHCSVTFETGHLFGFCSRLSKIGIIIYSIVVVRG